ncbi:MAG: NTP transferase domain-containing protein [Acidaminobacteraceae bacterium]
MLAVIMCSGLSKRMGQNKLLMTLSGKIIVEYVIENVIKSDFDEVIMIYGDDKLKNIADKYDIQAIHNPLREKGQSEAIKLAVRNAGIHSGISFFMGDQPLLRTETINLLLNEFCKTKKNIIMPTYNGVVGAPVIFPLSLSEEFLKLEGDVGGKAVINSNVELISKIEIKDVRESMDIDNKEDLEKLEKVLG